MLDINKFAYPVKATTHKINGFISDDKKACEALTKFIFNHGRITIEAPTGAGKTYWVLNYFRAMVATVDNPFIFAVPTQALADQIAEEYQLPCIRQGSGIGDIKTAESSNAVVCCYDSLHKLKDGVRDSIVFLDESHHLVNDAGFKPKQMNQAFELALTARKTILISATPTPYMDKLGFKAIRIKQAKTPPLEIIPVWLTDKPLNHLLANLSKSKPGKIEVVFYDNKSELNSLKQLLIKRGKASASQISILESGTKKDNEVYQAIIKESIIPEGIKYLFTTRLIADGVNIKNKNIGRIHMVKVSNEELFIQYPARFRKLDKKNVLSYRSESEPKEIRSVEDNLNILYGQAHHSLRNIQNFEGKVNPDAPKTLMTRYRNDFAFRLNYKSEITGKFQVSDLAVFHSEIERRDNTATAREFYARIKDKYKYVSIIDQATESPEDTPEISAAIKSHKREEKRATNQAYLKLFHQWQVYLLAFYLHTKSYQIKELIESVIDVEAEPSEAYKFMNENSELFDLNISQPIKQFARLLTWGFSPDRANELLIQRKRASYIYRSKIGFSFLESVVHVQKLLSESHNLDAKEMARRNHLIKLREKLRPMIGKTLTHQQMRTAIQSVIGIDPRNRAKKIISELFILEDARTKDKKRVKIVQELTLKDLFLLKNLKKPEKPETQLTDNQGDDQSSIYKKDFNLVIPSEKQKLVWSLSPQPDESHG